MMTKCTCVYATAKNTPAVRDGFEMGGYVKEACPLHAAAEPAQNDRELLEAAAKAAGITLHQHGWNGERHLYVTKGVPTQWNPLTDDGDALRLAVKLKINIEHMKTLGGKEYGVNCWPLGRGDCGMSEDGDISDYAGATRRAIVRAAAALGANNV